jgi:hypothetical protein
MGSPLDLLTTVETDANGHYSYMWKSPPGGIYTVRANWSGDDDYSGADSSTIRLVVLASEYFYVGILLVVFLIVLLIVLRLTGRKTQDSKGDFDDWDFADYPQDY